MSAIFRDRIDAGRQLSAALYKYAGRSDVRVLALPRGGVPVGYEVAQSLAAPLDVFLVRKLGVPGHEEFAMGAIASDGVLVVDREVLLALQIDDGTLNAVVLKERQELERRVRRYREGRPAPRVEGCVVIVVDDGLATGSTMRAAVNALKQEKPARIVVAVPVAAPSVCDSFRHGEFAADQVVCLHTPEPFDAVSVWYADFAQTTDNEVQSLLAAHAGATIRSGDTTRQSETTA
ncbi:MAG: phosphoribosyltransferase family protein [Gemmatimonadaceae bacterium]